MPQTPREIVQSCLTFKHPDRIPRDLWLLPWASNHYPDTVDEISRRFPTDFATAQYFYPPSSRTKGDPYQIGHYTDEWGCVFRNIQAGVIGEVINPMIEDIADWKLVNPPCEQLPTDVKNPWDTINRYCAGTDKFVLTNCCPRPWERYQFLRGSENALMDVLMPDQGLRDLLKLIHDFYLRELEFWVKTDIDGITFMDDWGSQNQLLISPPIWREIFKPLYGEYCELAKSYGKFVFMHSDGYITDIYKDLIEIGVDAINSQLFCMDMSDLARRAKGRITFWGEIDRQHVLPSKDPEAGRRAVRQAASKLYDTSGGIIAQFEFGVGANPETAIAVFEEWERVDSGKRSAFSNDIS